MWLRVERKFLHLTTQRSIHWALALIKDDKIRTNIRDY